MILCENTSLVMHPCNVFAESGQTPMKILCVHGIGHAEARVNTWRNDWKVSIESSVHECDPTARAGIQQFAYDDLFAAEGVSSIEYLRAFAKLLKSWVLHTGDRGVFDFGVTDQLRWSIGMVAQWTVNEKLRTQLRDKLCAEILAFKPDVIIAHSLGGLVTYDALSHSASCMKLTKGGFNGALLTLGTQVGHPAVSEVFAGRIEYPKTLSRWWNLHNENDRVFTRAFSISAASNFREIRTPFEHATINHDADKYLTHDETRTQFWSELMQLTNGGARSAGATTKKGLANKRTKPSKAELASVTVSAAAAVAAIGSARPKIRALLVGIAEYANPSFNLNGPVNDVFLVSQTLQEAGIEPDAIRVVLNERATAAAIRERLQWLLNDAQDDDTMSFYFSGHGAQVPAYGRDAEVDRIDECLVPHDFDWQNGNAIFDDEFCALYSQLPYDSKFIALLDCCHAGGMQRAGVAGSGSNSQGVRSLELPDDIRHRALQWNKASQMWVPRAALVKRGHDLKDKMMRSEKKSKKALSAHDILTKVDGRVGEDGVLRRIGRGQALRGESPNDYDARRKTYGHKGPYMPILLEACAENESAYEYQHGSVAYGAFTYALCEGLNRGRTDVGAGKGKKSVTFEALIEATRVRVKPVARGPQTPQLVCATDQRKRPVFE
jgi:metacaspase-1